MRQIVCYGAGQLFKRVAPIIEQKMHILTVISSRGEPGRTIFGVPVITLEQYMAQYSKYEIIITASEDNRKEIKKDLEDAGITNYSLYYEVIDENRPKPWERVISYSDQLEDIILYHVFHDLDEIFYIDVGSNDPTSGSVTKLLYDLKNAHGINIEPLRDLVDRANYERKKDINICVGLGAMDGVLDFFVQGGLSSVLEKNITEHFEKKITIPITTLEKVCDENVPSNQQITFLKIDVEGYERNVLLGANFQKYRPMVIVMEATLPNTMIPCHDEWEDILTDNQYHYVFSYGVNRYYVADEHSELDTRFISMLEILSKYDVYTAMPIYLHP